MEQRPWALPMKLCRKSGAPFTKPRQVRLSCCNLQSKDPLESDSAPVAYIRTLFERMKLRVFFDLKIRSPLRRMLQSNDTCDPQGRACRVEVKQGYAVAEHVVDPAQSRRLWNNGQVRMEKPLVKAVPRTQHQTMCSQAHRPLIPIRCHVPDGEDSHAIPRRCAILSIAAIRTGLGLVRRGAPAQYVERLTDGGELAAGSTSSCLVW
jgi:hypothetical protein